MSTQSTLTANDVRVKRLIAAPRERVFRAWTEPQALAKWFHPSPKHTTDVKELNFRVGGRYCFAMHEGDQTWTVAGEYQIIELPERLAFTWRWEGAGNAEPATLVTVTFHAVDENQTEVELVHTGFTTVEECNNHEKGWAGTLEQLADSGI